MTDGRDFRGASYCFDSLNKLSYLLASLPESYDMLITALVANAEVPQMDVVTERLVQEERKQKSRGDDNSQAKATTTAMFSRRCVNCYYCGTSSEIALISVVI